jgi:hypothetical protein
LAATQPPLALQVEVEMVPLVHVPGPHTVFAGTLQVPAPSQLSLLQAETLAVHSLFGSVFAVAKTHEPPVGSTTWHSAHDETDAHSFPFWLCTQFIVVHSSGPAQAEPLALRRVQLVPPEQ